MTDPVIPPLPADPAPLGGAIQNVIDGNETVAVGAAIATIFYTVLSYLGVKEIIDSVTMAYVLMLAIPVTVVGGAVIRSKVWSKQSVKQEVAAAKATA